MNTIAVIILLVLATILVVLGIILSCICDEEDALVPIISCASAIFLYFVAYHLATPTERDVLAGKAVYQETITITQTGDSIKTYQIVWKGE